MALAVQESGNVELSDIVTSMLPLEPQHQIAVLCSLEIATRRHELVVALQERLERLGGGAA